MMPERDKTAGKKVRKREQAITALMSCRTIREAADSCGISQRTLLRWLKQPDFREAYREAKADLLKVATTILMASSADAAATLAAIFSDAEAAPSARVAAAVNNLRLALDAFALENIEARLLKLEENSNPF